MLIKGTLVRLEGREGGTKAAPGSGHCFEGRVLEVLAVMPPTLGLTFDFIVPSESNPREGEGGRTSIVLSGRFEAEPADAVGFARWVFETRNSVYRFDVPLHAPGDDAFPAGGPVGHA
jgi:hypothetical protein